MWSLISCWLPLPTARGDSDILFSPCPNCNSLWFCVYNNTPVGWVRLRPWTCYVVMLKTHTCGPLFFWETFNMYWLIRLLLACLFVSPSRLPTCLLASPSCAVPWCLPASLAHMDPVQSLACRCEVACVCACSVCVIGSGVVLSPLPPRCRRLRVESLMVQSHYTSAPFIGHRGRQQRLWI